MVNYIINLEDSLENSLSEEYYFLSILQIAQNNNFFDINYIESIQLQLVNILTEVVGYYTQDKSYSVRVETADQLMLSICYTISLFLKNQLTIKERVSSIKEKEIKYLFSEGEKILKAKLDKCLHLLDAAYKTKLKTENYAYIDTINYGIPLFFKEYDSRFASHEAPGSIDYPLAFDEMNLVGIEYIEDYLNKLILENKFCSYFDGEEIQVLLKGFNKDCKHMLINIFTLVLTNSLGCTLLGKEKESLDISRGDRVYLKSIMEKLSPVELEGLMFNAAEKLCVELLMEDKHLIDYIKITISKIVQEIRINVETNTLDKIFITLSKSENKLIQYVDGNSVSNKMFRIITEEIRDCSNVEDKIKIIREEFHSLKDLTDVLSADCIFDDEFMEIFKVLDNFEIALLIKSALNDEALGADYGTESEKQWHKKLNIYLDELESLKREEILSISQEIKL
ncbi:MAG: DUF6179 domain-containing protein [Clostridiaceae bacterium]